MRRRPVADDRIAPETIDAPAEAIFALLADPANHAAIDGTGWVRESLDSEPLTAAGQIFRMAMYHPNHPDGGYQIANLVQVLDRPNAISWKPGIRRRRRQPEFWRLGVALRSRADRTPQHRRHPALRLVGCP